MYDLDSNTVSVASCKKDESNSTNTILLLAASCICRRELRDKFFLYNTPQCVYLSRIHVVEATTKKITDCFNCCRMFPGFFISAEIARRPHWTCDLGSWIVSGASLENDGSTSTNKNFLFAALCVWCLDLRREQDNFKRALVL